MSFRAITVTIYGETKPIREWAKMYDLDVQTIRKRMRMGISGEDLLQPYEEDRLSVIDVRRLWHGRWVTLKEYYKNKRKPIEKPVRWNKHQKWVFVGKGV